MRLEITNWVRRDEPDDGSDASPAKWHFVESVIADAAITRCGRRMEPEVEGKELLVMMTKPLTRSIDQVQLCKAGCD